MLRDAVLATGSWHSSFYGASIACNGSTVGTVITLSNSIALFDFDAHDSCEYFNYFTKDGETYSDPWYNSGYMECVCGDCIP